MRKLKLTLIALIVTTVSNAQMIQKVVDDMTDKVDYYSMINLIVANDTRTKGVTISPIIRNTNGKITSTGFICDIIGLGNCNEDNKIIIMFDDDTKFTLSSWNKFNCKGTSYFSFSESQKEQVSKKPIKKIRFTNGESFESVTNAPSRSHYFVDFYAELKLIIQSNKEE